MITTHPSLSTTEQPRLKSRLQNYIPKINQVGGVEPADYIRDSTLLVLVRSPAPPLYSLSLTNKYGYSYANKPPAPSPRRPPR